MARNFKISFPLPRRPSASPSTTTPGSQCSGRNNHDGSPTVHPGSKAERMLGASEPDQSDQRKKPSRKEKRQLRKFPSFMSVTLSEVDGESASDGFPFPGMQMPSEPLRPPTQYLNRQGSSPSLGDMYTNGSTHGDNTQAAADPQPRRAGSSLALRSHYDPKKVPLPVSQQTSASSARDMALRKGFPPISAPSSFREVDAVKDTESKISHLRSDSGGSKVSMTSKSSGKSSNRVNRMPRRRLSDSGPPSFCPNPDHSSHAITSPPVLAISSLPKTPSPNAPSTRSKWWHRKTSTPNTSPLIPLDDEQDQEFFGDNFSSIKVNIKKPKSGVTGTRNWFDGLEDEEQTLELLQQPETSSLPEPEGSEPPSSMYEMMSQEARSPRISQRKSSFSSKSQRIGASGRKLSFRLEGDAVPSSPLNGLQSTPSILQAKSLRSASSTKGTSTGIDLHVESFLELSSSEDERCDASASSEVQAHCRGRQIHPSSDRKRHESEILDANAHRAQPIRPRSTINRTQKRPLSKRSTSSEYVPPVPRIPDRPQLSQWSSSTRWRDMMEGMVSTTESTVDRLGNSVQDHSHPRKAPSARMKKTSSFQGSKLMKVTSEEEKLLEAMRDKRASIRQDDFEKGFKTAMQLQDIVARPKTAGADGRNSRSSIFGSRSSVSTSSQEYGIQKHMPGSRLSTSVDDMVLGNSYPFPEIPTRGGRERLPPNLRSPMEFTSPPKASPSLSFTPSDILPSTPNSRNSPLTPPPGHGTMGAYGRSNTLSPPRSNLAMRNSGHDRKRTTSSSVVMLDGVEQHAQEFDEENEITGWAMDRW